MCTVMCQTVSSKEFLESLQARPKSLTDVIKLRCDHFVTLRLFPDCGCSFQKRQNYSHRSQLNGSQRLGFDEEDCLQKILLGLLNRWCYWYRTCWPMQEMLERRFDLWVGKITRKRKWQPTAVFLPGESHRPRSLAAYSPQGRTVRHG